jgi:hypothetical protein
MTSWLMGKWKSDVCRFPLCDLLKAPQGIFQAVQSSLALSVLRLKSCGSSLRLWLKGVKVN